MVVLLAAALCAAGSGDAAAGSEASSAQPKPTWPVALYNPHPAKGDFLLPLPCGGAMVFRPVDVPVGPGPLDDHAVTLGQSDTEEGYNDYLRSTFLSAPFKGPPGSRRYYIGKYDVTRDQYAALTAAQCPKPSIAGRVPQTEVSWTDAIVYASKWSSWLLSHAKDMLPRRGNTVAFVRLPTEAEWEFAARGGTHVSQSDFLAPTWPMPEGIKRYVMAGTEIAGGHAQPVGEMLPNPLGLYDMLGDVSQMMLEPYRLNRVGRLQGQAGGIIIRGGDYTFDPDTLVTALRDEIPPYNARTGQPTRLATMGFRLVLAADSIGSISETQAAQNEFQQISGLSAKSADKAQRMLSLLQQETKKNTALTSGLNQLSSELAQARREQTDAAQVAVLAQIEAAAALAQNIWSFTNTANLQLKMADLWNKPILPSSGGGGQPLANATYNPALAEKERTAAARTLVNRAGSVDGYMLLLRQLALASQAESFPTLVENVTQGFHDRGEDNMLAFPAIIEREVKQLVAGHAIQSDQVLSDIMAVRRIAP
jgi:formylglycine-generating enzyme required for sulfatase activity